MILFHQSSDIVRFVKQKKQSGLRIGFVPTMGALHQGHLSLIHQASLKTDIVVCSVFVNPTQFNQASDLANYPRDVGKDIRLLTMNSCEVLFHPSVEEVYGNDFSKDSSEGLGDFINLLEGAKRPGHFDGVVTILKKLFGLIDPDEVFFGQKDYQQCLLVRSLVKRNFSHIVFNLCPTAREPDGLALSSRNARLTEKERAVAPLLYQSLKWIADHWNPENFDTCRDQALKILDGSDINPEYFTICDPDTLHELKGFQPNAVVLIAAWLGETRLIDNMMLGETMS